MARSYSRCFLKADEIVPKMMVSVSCRTEGLVVVCKRTGRKKCWSFCLDGLDGIRIDRCRLPDFFQGKRGRRVAYCMRNGSKLEI